MLSNLFGRRIGMIQVIFNNSNTRTIPAPHTVVVHVLSRRSTGPFRCLEVLAAWTRVTTGNRVCAFTIVYVYYVPPALAWNKLARFQRSGRHGVFDPRHNTKTRAKIVKPSDHPSAGVKNDLRSTRSAIVHDDREKLPSGNKKKKNKITRAVVISPQRRQTGTRSGTIELP